MQKISFIILDKLIKNKIQIFIFVAISFIFFKIFYTDFNYLFKQAGFDISITVIKFNSSNSYLHAIIIGVVNTLRVAALSLFIATALGFIFYLGIASKNLILNKLSYIIVDTIKNLPVYVILIFVYLLFTLFLPDPIGPMSFFNNSVFLSKSGIHFPWYSYGAIEYPILGVFGVFGGNVITPEFLTLVLGLSLYTSAFIADIIMSGVQSFPKELLESIDSLNFSQFQGIFLIIIPYTIRLIFPLLVNQYINLVKNTSLGVGLGYPELVSITQLTINHTGKALEAIVIMILVYLKISLILSVIMNSYEKHLRLKCQ